MIQREHLKPRRDSTEPRQDFIQPQALQLAKEHNGEKGEAEGENEQIQAKSTGVNGNKSFVQPHALVQAKQQQEAQQPKDAENEQSTETSVPEKAGLANESGSSMDTPPPPASTSGGTIIIDGTQCSFSIEGRYVIIEGLTEAQSILLLKNPVVAYQGNSVSFNDLFKQFLIEHKQHAFLIKAYHTDNATMRFIQMVKNRDEISVIQYAVQPDDRPQAQQAQAGGDAPEEVPQSPAADAQSAESVAGSQSESAAPPSNAVASNDVNVVPTETGDKKEDSPETPEKEAPTGPYWTHEWHTDRFGNETVFIWEVGGTRWYSNASPGYAYLQKMSKKQPGDADYDPRFERFRKLPNIHRDGIDASLNFWVKRSPGWDDPQKKDDGTADFQDLAEFKDVAHNKKGTGFYYLPYVFDPEIDKKLEAQKLKAQNKKYIAQTTDYKGYVSAPSGIILHTTPDPDDPAYWEIKDNGDSAKHTISQNVPLTIIAEGNENAEGWVMVRTATGAEGWIERRYISKEPPATKKNAFPSYLVKPGDTLEQVIKEYYANYGFETGNDMRTVALAIYLFNKDKPGAGIYRNDAKYKQSKKANALKDEFDPWMKETRANYQSVELYAGGEILLPPKWYINEMRDSGKVGVRPGWANTLIESGRVVEGFIDGIGFGFVDAAVGAATDLWDMIMSIFSGEIFSQIADMFETLWDLGLEGIWEAIKEFGTSTWQEVQDAWNNPNPYERGKYFGEIVGMILFEVVLAILTWGIGSSVRNTARVQKIMKLFPDFKKVHAPDNVMDHADDIKDLNKKLNKNTPDIDAGDARKLDAGKKKVDTDKDKDPDNKKDKTDDDKTDEEKNKENATELAEASAYIASQDIKNPSPDAQTVLTHINSVPTMKIAGKPYKVSKNPAGNDLYDFSYNPTFYKKYSQGGGSEIEKQKVNELNARKKRLSEVELQNNLTARGFKNAGEVVERLGNLRNRVKNVDIPGLGKIDDAEVGIRGSSITGKSTKGGEFRPGVDGIEKPSDIDFFFSSEKLDKFLNNKGIDISEPISPQDLKSISPELHEILSEFAQQSRDQLGRKSDAYFLSGEILDNLTDGDFILR